MTLRPAMISALAASLALAPVVLRGGSVIEAPIERISIEGVAVGGAAPRVIGWDRIRAVTGERAAEAEPFETLADAAWRARTRLDRGDIHGAARALDRIETDLAGADGPTARSVFETSLAVRGRLGDPPRALAAALELRRLGAEADGLDPVTGLAPAAPPVMSPEHAQRALAILERSTEPATSRLRAFYRAALAADPALIPPGEPRDDAVRLLAEIARAVSGDEAARRRLIESITPVRESARPEPWRIAWVRAASARSLIAQGAANDDPALTRLGAAEFLTIPALVPAESPYLAGLALAEAAAALESLGEHSPATTLRRELARVSPDHPAAGSRPASDGGNP